MLNVLFVIWCNLLCDTKALHMDHDFLSKLQPCKHMIHGGNLHGLQLYEVTSPAIARPPATILPPIAIQHSSKFTSSLAICGVREALANSVSFIHHPDIKNPPPPCLHRPLPSLSSCPTISPLYISTASRYSQPTSSPSCLEEE